MDLFSTTGDAQDVIAFYAGICCLADGHLKAKPCAADHEGLPLASEWANALAAAGTPAGLVSSLR